MSAYREAVILHISIHALRGEGDARLDREYVPNKSISIHALRGEGDEGRAEKISKTKSFQSTPSVGRATER